MLKKYAMPALMFAVILLPALTVDAQEFPIAVGSDTAFAYVAACDGQNWLVPILGDSLNSNNIDAQFVSPSGSLLGTRISLGAQGVAPGALARFDGVNYFLVWEDFSENFKGQFIDTQGNLVGTSFNIATGLLPGKMDIYNVAFGDTAYLAIFVKADSILYGQMVNKSGSLIGSQIQISNTPARETYIAYDGTNYLVVWVNENNDKDIYGQFIGKDGLLVGSNFVIDNDQNYSDNPISLAFDGARYLMAFHEAPTLDAPWTLIGYFITTAGTVEDTIIICDSIKHPYIPSVAFDGKEYFITWSQLLDSTMIGRFFDTSGVPIDTPFVLFGPSDNKSPIGGVGFGGGQYLAVTTRLDSNFSDGDVYGRFIQPLSAVWERNPSEPKAFMLSQNYTNPVRLTARIPFNIQSNSFVTLKVFDAVGREARVLLSGNLHAGSYTCQWNAGNLANGVYFYYLQVASLTEIRKFVVQK